MTEALGAEKIDLPRIMAMSRIDLHEFLSDDNLHLSETGNKHYAQIVFDVIIENNFYQPF